MLQAHIRRKICLKNRANILNLYDDPNLIEDCRELQRLERFNSGLHHAKICILNLCLCLYIAVETYQPDRNGVIVLAKKQDGSEESGEPWIWLH